ncbi:RluA family pseudouridine synthase [Stomatobaculum longum]|uniref:RluA family pseudouridine synthase n=1 Tax=Stomatobaculum longum TaxID=796942 RepID=UPI0028EF8070|nr:RluA family pseudouridine synthase [Stomatobaculum longum]
MKEYKIAAAAAGQRLDRFLAKILPEADTAFLHRMLRKKNITRNDKKAEGSERVEAGDVIRLWFSEETFRKFAGTQPDSRRYPRWDGFSAAVILENEMLLAVNKPAGMLSQKAAPEDVSLNEYMLSYLISRNEFQPENPNGFRPGVVNRLDRNTSGLVLAAKTRAAAEELSVQLRDKRLQKYYLACVKGEVREAKRLSAFLYKDKEKNQVQIHSRKSCAEDREIQTAYRPLAVQDGISLLEVQLLTGRSHQIRAQLAAIGHPILGDPKYGDPAENARLAKRLGVRHQLLHAFQVQFPEETGVLGALHRQSILAPPPDPFRRLFPEAF